MKLWLLSSMCFIGGTCAFMSAMPPTTSTRPCRGNQKDTALAALIPVPNGFFTISFGVTGLMWGIVKNINRNRMEELAWNERLMEAREARMAADPTLVETDLLKQEAAMEWSAYGPEAQAARKRVKVMEKEEGSYRREPTEFRMTDQEIQEFEQEYGIDYDPYYDDPYEEEELPEDMKYRVDKTYGDRIYENGEIFYKDEDSGLFYRQGSKPRIKNFW